MVSQNSWSWGTYGHRVTGIIAENFLEEETKEKIRNLTDQPLSELALWMDIYSRKVRDSKPWHYVNIPKGKDYLPSRDCASLERCLPWAINHFITVLKNPLQTHSKRKKALAFVIHLVGDLHQPLHCAYREDRGGNFVRVDFFGKRRNLHAVWDTSMLQHENLPLKAYTYKLIKHYSSETVIKFQGGTISDWIKESRSLLPRVYDFPGNGRLWHTYQKKNAPIVADQLFKAGTRIAYVLNNVFSAR